MRLAWLAVGMVVVGCGADAFVTADGGTDASGTDGSVPDGAPPPDGAGPDSSVRFCSQAFTMLQFCEDWDDASVPPAVWTPAATGGATVSVSNVAPVSLPNILLARFPPASSGGASATVARPASINPRMTIEFDARFDNVTSNYSFLEISGAGGYKATLSMTGASIQVAGATTDVTTLAPVTVGDQHHGKLTLSQKSSLWYADLDMGPIGSVEVETQPAPTSVELQLGVFATSGTTSATNISVRLDNIVVTSN